METTCTAWPLTEKISFDLYQVVEKAMSLTGWKHACFSQNLDTWKINLKRILARLGQQVASDDLLYLMKVVRFLHVVADCSH